MTEFSETVDKEEFDCNTILLECEYNKYVYMSGLEIFKFKTGDKNIAYISLMGNNMIPYTFAVGEKHTYFLTSHYKFIENDKIEEGILLNAINTSLDPYDYHVEKCGLDSFKKLEHSLIPTCWPGHGGDEDDFSDLENVVADDEVDWDEDLIETRYLNGNNEVVKF